MARNAKTTSTDRVRRPYTWPFAGAVGVLIVGLLAAIAGAIRCQIGGSSEPGRWVVASGHRAQVDQSGAAMRQLAALLEDVRSSTGFRYATKDDRGVGMDSLKIIEGATGSYLGVYHHRINGVMTVRLSTSSDLLNWKHVVDLDTHASQATIARLPDGGFLVVYEKEDADRGSHLRFRYYEDLRALSRAEFQHSYDASRSLSRISEGTPNIYSVQASSGILDSRIEVGFHYYRNGDVDRQGIGVLVNFSSWTPYVDTTINILLHRYGRLEGNIGSRDTLDFEGNRFNIHEAQSVKSDFGSWGVYLYEFSTGSIVQLAMQTHNGSRAFGNPTYTNVTSPNGRSAFVATVFLFAESAGSGEAGELIFYKELDDGLVLIAKPDD